jgi:chemotaxis protein MotB
MNVDEAQEAGGEEGAPAWMATFSDLATLLLTFFVLLLSFANMDIQNFKTAMGSVKEAMGVQFVVDGDHESMATDLMELSPVQSGPHITISDFSQLAAERVKRFVKEKGLEGQIEVEAQQRGVVLRANDAVFFTVGSADLRPEGDRALEVISSVFGEFDGDLAVQGHTDSVPMSSGRFPSNWELSTARATAVMRHLTTRLGIPSKRVHVAGYADTRPLAEGNDEASYRRNRRVEFLFEFPVVKGNLITEGAFRNLTGPYNPAAAAGSGALPRAPRPPTDGSAVPTATAAPTASATADGAPDPNPSRRSGPETAPPERKPR